MKKLFVLGDSISIHYGPYLERWLEGRFAYDRKGRADADGPGLDYESRVNGGDSANCLAYFAGRDDLRCDVLLLNCGLHDIKTTYKRQVAPEDYERNLRGIVALSALRGIETLWVSSTPVDSAVHNQRCASFRRYGEDVLLYNGIAEKAMAESGVPAIDLFAFTSKLGGREIYEDHVHFTQPVRQLQAAFIAGWLIGNMT